MTVPEGRMLLADLPSEHATQREFASAQWSAGDLVI